MEKVFSMTKDRDPEASLGDQNTFQGNSKPRFEDLDSKSLGDQATFAGNSIGNDYLDDDMEIVDIESRYQVERVLGKGGMGEVLLATDMRLNRKVAIKRILGDASRSRSAVNRLLTEAKSIASLNHSNIVQIYDYGCSKDGPFLIMEFVDGNSLLDRCREGAIPLEEAIDLACQLCDGLGRAHAAGIIHRDIKPANILLTTDGVPKLTDFGLAKSQSADADMTMAGAILGTLDFMPPEQRRDAALSDARSDLWSLAATLYQMVTGKSPKIIKFTEVPKSLQNVLGKALEDEKEDRYQNAKEFRDALLATKQASAIGEVVLEQGECPSCGTKNLTNRKFCRQCAASIEVPCLSCSSKIPMWEQVCDSCGAKQDDLLEKRRQKMASDQAEAEDLLESHEFEKALALAIALRDEPDLRLQHLKRWAENFVSEIQKTREPFFLQTETLMSEALQHRSAYDYTSALRTLEQVPNSLVDAPLSSHRQTVGQLREELEGISAEIKRLDQIVRERVSKRDLKGVLDDVETLLKLQPDRKELLGLRSQLIQRETKLRENRDEALTAAKLRFQSFDYENCLKEITKIDESLITSEIRSLQEQATASRDRLRFLRQTIMAHIKDKQLDGLLAKVVECLTLQPAAPDLLKLRDQLQEREAKNAATIAEMMQIASSLRDQCQFQEAAAVLERIPAELMTDDSEYLLAECRRWANERQRAMQALQTAMKSESYAHELSSAVNYAQQIGNLGLRDPVFGQQYNSCRKAIQAKKEAEEAAQRNQQMMSRLFMASTVLFFISLMLGAALWMRSARRASSIASALAEKRWDDAIVMDPDNVEVFLGRAEQELNRSNWNKEQVTADLNRAIAIAPNNQRLMSLKTLAAEKAKAEADRIAAEKAKAKAEEDRNAAEKAILAEPPLVNSINLALKKLPAGKFQMGEGSRAHEVTLTQPFYIGIVEVTQEQYERVMGTNPSNFKDLTNPVEQVSWEDAMNFCRKLSELPEEKNAGRVYRLPTEAEWEYACRAGTTTKFTFGDDESKLGDYAWFNMNASSKTHPVGNKKPNAWGLFDMYGNVWEWCSDWYDEYPKGAVSDPNGPQKGELRALRGGSWDSRAAIFRSANRSKGVPDDPNGSIFGFRVALSYNEIPQEANWIAAEKAKAEADRIAAEKAKAEADRIAAEKAKAEADRIATEKAILAEPPLVNSINLILKKLPAGKFQMGEGSRAHEVTLTQPFYIGVVEVTQSQYKRVMRTNPSEFNGLTNPVEQVSWEDAMNFCRKLSELPAEKKAGRVYRLPTEAEWEYACRAGTTTEFTFGDDESKIGDYAWFDLNSSSKTHPVGNKKPNAWGLFDMHGNVWEWCSDWYDEYPKGFAINPNGRQTGWARVVRGGSYRNVASLCRSAHRINDTPTQRFSYFGFRVALSDTEIPQEADRIAAEKAILAEPALVNSINLALKKLPAGKFEMGEGNRVHEVTLTQPFYIGIVEVTQEQYERVMGTSPSNFKNLTNPVEQVSWEDAMNFCRKLSELPAEKNAGRVYRLPTEAEWEYACRAGTRTKFTFGNDQSKLVDYAWFDLNSSGKTHPVAEKKPNAWGLYDMHGNVWEWCSDWYDEFPNGATSDPNGPKTGRLRVVRGGSWYDRASLCRSTNRGGNSPDARSCPLGFRIALSSTGIPQSPEADK
jgi:formylglycine-generating enzyme required for sulfatase activity/serine/threonine protein kinase